MADWHWEAVTDDLLDCLPPAALAAVRQVAEELTIRESMIFLDGREPEFTKRVVSETRILLSRVPAEKLSRADAVAQVCDVLREVSDVGSGRAALQAELDVLRGKVVEQPPSLP